MVPPCGGIVAFATLAAQSGGIEPAAQRPLAKSEPAYLTLMAMPGKPPLASLRLASARSLAVP